MLSLTTLVAGYRMAPMHVTAFSASSRAPSVAMIIGESSPRNIAACQSQYILLPFLTPELLRAAEPELFVECAIYDNDMEEAMCDLKNQLAQAQATADEASKRMSKLEANVGDLQKQFEAEKGERESLEKQLERSVANAAAASAAAETLELKTTKLMKELKDQGVEHATTLVRARLSPIHQSAAHRCSRCEREGLACDLCWLARVAPVCCGSRHFPTPCASALPAALTAGA